MMLGFETVGRSASAVLVDQAGAEIAYRDLAGAPSEAGLVPLLDALMRLAGPVRALAWAQGPGSFTGLRVGALAVRTLAWIDQLPVHGVDSLAALACERGDGLWWVLLPLKRDTTFHGLFQVSAGRLTTLAASAAAADAGAPVLHPATAQATAVGPALAAKPGLAHRWCPGVALGPAAGPSARGVARLALTTAARAWPEALPAYLQASAPELQRERALAQRAPLPPAGAAGPDAGAQQPLADRQPGQG
jgi:tRNA threonylcarbamoyl adenosine modification protein YeaZ